MSEKCVPKPGDWVLLKGNSVLACGSDVKALIELAEKHGFEDVVISKEPISQHCYY